MLRKYETAEDILKEFFETRRRKYRERKTFLRGMLEAEASRLENQARFIVEKIEGKIAIGMPLCFTFGVRAAFGTRHE